MLAWRSYTVRKSVKTSVQMAIHIKLKELREKRGLSQNALARQMGQSLANIQKIEYGNVKSVTLETLDLLCESLDCEPGDLLIRIHKEPSTGEV
jgi:putative transcriptional regulator